MTIDKDYVEHIKTLLTNNRTIVLDANHTMIVPKLEEVDNLNNYLAIVNRIVEHYNEPSYYGTMIKDEVELMYFANFLQFFFPNKIISLKGDVFILGEDIEIDGELANFIIGNAKIAHLLIEREEYFLPKNEAARKHMLLVREKKKALKERQKKQNKGGDGIGIRGVLKAVCNRHPSINYLNVNGLTYYQLMDSFNTLQQIDSYDFGLSSMLAGAEQKDKLEHYSSDYK